MEDISIVYILMKIYKVCDNISVKSNMVEICENPTIRTGIPERYQTKSLIDTKSVTRIHLPLCPTKNC